MTHITVPGDPNADDSVRDAPRHGDSSHDPNVMSIAVDLPWDEYLGDGAGERIRDGSLGVVRHAYPAGAARDLHDAGTVTGMLGGDAALRERVGAVAVGVAALHHRPARMPHQPGDEPNAWWVAEERTLYWLPWAGEAAEPYGLQLLDDRQADAVVVLAPDASWTVFRTGLPRRGSGGTWAELPERLREAVSKRVPDAATLESAHWTREGDTVSIRWRDGERIRTVSIAVNRRPSFTSETTR